MKIEVVVTQGKHVTLHPATDRANAETIAAQVRASGIRMDSVLIRVWCPQCKAFSFNAEHICIKGDLEKPCAKCGAGTVFCTAGAPGYGSVTVCENNHRTNSTIRVSS